MIKIENISIDPFDPNNFILNWDVFNRRNEDLDDFYIEVWRSKQRTGDYKKVSVKIDPSGNSTYVDKSTSKLNYWVMAFYKVKVVRKSDKKERFFGPAGLDSEPLPQDRAIIERNRKELFHFGRNVLVLSSPMEGLRCSCFNHKLGHVTVPNCKKCHGTSFLKGFTTHFFTKMDLPPEEISQPFANAEEQKVIKDIWTADFPILRPGHLIITEQNDRFIVSNVRPVIPHNATIEQRVTCVRVKLTDPEMHAPVPENFKKLAL